MPLMPITASRSASARPVSNPLTRTQTRWPSNFGAYSLTPARALAFSGAGTEFSRSSRNASAGSPERLVEKLFAIGRDVEEAAGQGHENYSAAVTFGCGAAASLVTPAAASLPIAAAS